MSDRAPAQVLAEAARAARYAPSALNTQPWRWVVGPDGLDLYADRSRQLDAADPDGRLLTVSCGVALHHARVALAAQGWETSVARFPGPTDLLARITLGSRIGMSPDAMRLFQAAEARHTDRRPVVDVPVERAAWDEVVAAATGEGVNLHRLTPDQVSDLASAAGHADALAAADPALRAELALWVGGDRPSGAGLPDTVIPARPPQTVVPEREFDRRGTLEVGEGHARAAVYAVLFGDTDDPPAWLRAGEALSAAWLTATRLGLAVLPFTAVIEIPATRQIIRNLLANLGHPYVVLRVGTADPEHAGPPHTPRLPPEQVIDTSGVDTAD
ncbi:MAG TPA: nitroreductase family protein [Micromonosporaceae bacterium]|nr:nitroreductase family protein [Micromonosporaceae bacterium]